MIEKEAGMLGKMVAGFGRPAATAAKKQMSGRLGKLLGSLVKRMSTGRMGKVMQRTSPITGGEGQTQVTARKPLLWAKALTKRVQARAGKRVTERTAGRMGGGILGLGGYGAYRAGKGPSEKEAQWRTECAFAAALGALARRNNG